MKEYNENRLIVFLIVVIVCCLFMIDHTLMRTPITFDFNNESGIEDFNVAVQRFLDYKEFQSELKKLSKKELERTTQLESKKQEYKKKYGEFSK